MCRFRKLVLASVFAVLAVACAGDATDEPVDLSEITVPETTTSTAVTTETDPATGETTSESDTPTTAPVEETPTTTTPADGTAEPEPEEVGPDNEPTDPDPGEVVYWRPGLDKEVLASVDPETENAGYWETREWELEGAPEPQRYYVFHHYRADDDERIIREVFTEVLRHSVNAFIGEYLWFPYRFDLSWDQYPDTVAVVATHPLGEQLSASVDANLATRQETPVGKPAPATADPSHHTVRRTPLAGHRLPFGTRLPACGRSWRFAFCWDWVAWVGGLGSCLVGVLWRRLLWGLVNP